MSGETRKTRKGMRGDRGGWRFNRRTSTEWKTKQRAKTAREKNRKTVFWEMREKNTPSQRLCVFPAL